MGAVAGSRSGLWIVWAALFALLPLDAVALFVLAPARADSWYAAEASVVQFVLGLLALTAGVGTFALRETLALRELRSGTLDPSTARGFAQIRRMLVALWSLCLAVAALGNVLAWGSARPLSAMPFLLASAALLLLHAPRGWLFARSPA
jgi:hypothetical protein